MKPVWNSLLLTLNLVIMSAGTSVVLAEPTAPVPVRESSAKATETTTPLPPVVSSEVMLPHSANTFKAQTPKQPSSPKPEVNQPAPSPEATKKPDASKPSWEGISDRLKLMEADRLYLRGEVVAAEKLYRLVKAPFAREADRQLPEPILNPAQLSPAGKVYWREAEAGTAQKVQSRVLVPLRLLVEQYPEFIPGHLRLVQVTQEYDRPKEALEILDRATNLYPDQPDLIKAKVAALVDAKKWMEASLTARQFALINSKAPAAPEFTQLADENLQQSKKHLRSKLRRNAIANVITGALGYALTGSLFGPFSAVQTTTMLLRGESAVGESVSKRARKQLELVDDKAVVDYVNKLGQKLAQATGRNDFQYEFYVVLEDDLNAFALPGGKVFVNAGAITRTNSEAELAGLLAHELSHAVLSHGFQLVAEGNLISNVAQFVPYGGTLANIFTLDYSRDMERQADTLGTQLIASQGYAADGVRNLMVTLKQQQKSQPPTWLASHPSPANRVRYLEDVIERNGYNRYAYEGVATHAQIKERVKKLLAQKEQIKNKKRQERQEEQRRRGPGDAGILIQPF